MGDFTHAPRLVPDSSSMVWPKIKGLFHITQCPHNLTHITAAAAGLMPRFIEVSVFFQPYISKMNKWNFSLRSEFPNHGGHIISCSGTEGTTAESDGIAVTADILRIQDSPVILCVFRDSGKSENRSGRIVRMKSQLYAAGRSHRKYLFQKIVAVLPKFFLTDPLITFQKDLQLFRRMIGSPARQINPLSGIDLIHCRLFEPQTV